jgi:hypothetical protein
MVGAVLVVVIGSSLYAQSSAISIGGGYERGEASMQFTHIDSCCREDEFENGINQSSAMVAYSFQLAGISFETRAVWTNSDVLLTATFPRVVVMTPVSERREEIRETVWFTMQTIQLELICRTSIVENLSVGGGPVIGYRSIRDYEHWQVRLDDNARPPKSHWRIQDGALESMNYLALGALVTAEYDIPLTQQVSIVPELRLRGDFTSPFVNTYWNIFSAGGALSIRYSL